MDIELILNEDKHKMAIFILKRELFIQEWLGIMDEETKDLNVLRVKYCRDYHENDKVYIKGMMKMKGTRLNRHVNKLKCPICQEELILAVDFNKKIKKRVPNQCPSCHQNYTINVKVVDIV